MLTRMIMSMSMRNISDMSMMALTAAVGGRIIMIVHRNKDPTVNILLSQLILIRERIPFCC